MSLMARMWAPIFSSSLASVDVIFQIVFRPAAVEDVAGVADGRFAERARFCTASIATRMLGIQLSGSKMRNRSMPACGRLVDERFARRCRDNSYSRRRSSRAAASETGCWESCSRRSASRCQGAFLQKPHGRVERRPAPHLDREHARAQPGVRLGDVRACRACATAWPAAIDGRRETSCRSSAAAFASRIHWRIFRGPAFAAFAGCRRESVASSRTAERAPGAPRARRPVLHQRIAVDDHFGQIRATASWPDRGGARSGTAPAFRR